FDDLHPSSDHLKIVFDDLKPSSEDLKTVFIQCVKLRCSRYHSWFFLYSNITYQRYELRRAEVEPDCREDLCATSWL
ncbi:MAG: hypothetical protein JXR52_01350, partial [Bacteroidales bacterium]|nr:hypothetical protein [Bacteroidales bacterium]